MRSPGRKIYFRRLERRYPEGAAAGHYHSGDSRAGPPGNAQRPAGAQARGQLAPQRATARTAACMLVGEQASVMLLSHETFAQFAKLPMADPTTHTLALYCFSVSARDEVDTVAEAALAAGGTEADGPEDHGFMYSRSFFDLDGHGWQVMWMESGGGAAGPRGVRGLHAGRRRPGLTRHHVRPSAGWPLDVVVQAGQPG